MYPVYALHESLGYRLSVAARIQERRLENSLRQLGLTRITWCVLLAVGQEKLTQPSDIANFIRIDRTAASRALRQMEGMALIRRETGKGDRRTTEVQLTEAGLALLERGIPLAQANNAEMDARLSPEEQRRIREILAKLIDGQTETFDRF